MLTLKEIVLHPGKGSPELEQDSFKSLREVLRFRLEDQEKGTLNSI